MANDGKKNENNGGKKSEASTSNKDKKPENKNEKKADNANAKKPQNDNARKNQDNKKNNSSKGKDKTHKGPVRIGYILRKFPVLSETFVLNEILALEAQGIAVQIFSMERPNDPRYHEHLARLKGEIRYLPLSTSFRTYWTHNVAAARHFKERYWKALWHAIKTFSPSCVRRVLQAAPIANHVRRKKITHLHSHFANRPTSVAYYVSAITGISYSFTAHAADIFRHHVEENVLKDKMKHARFIVTVSDYNLAHLSKMAPDSRKKVVIVNNGIDFERFKPKARAGKQPFTILCVSRLVEKKGISVLIEACRQLDKAGHDFRCKIIGAGSLFTDLKKSIEKHGLMNKVKLMGPKSQNEVLACYQEADLAVMPAIIAEDGNREGLPVSIVEALACGLPVIATPITGIPEVVRHLQNGLVVRENNSKSLAEAIETMMTEPKLRKQMASHARSSVAPRFDIKQTSSQLAKLISDTTKKA